MHKTFQITLHISTVVATFTAESADVCTVDSDQTFRKVLIDNLAVDLELPSRRSSGIGFSLRKTRNM